MTTNTAALMRAPAPSLSERVSAAFTRWVEDRSRRRAELAMRSLDRHTLKDIGLDRSEIGSVIYGDPRQRIMRCTPEAW
ncbi:MAG: hypothetical protein AAF441_14790 [Pseudomonadota bacterium]